MIQASPPPDCNAGRSAADREVLADLYGGVTDRLAGLPRHRRPPAGVGRGQDRAASLGTVLQEWERLRGPAGRTRDRAASMATFFRKWMRCWARAAGSASCQNGCPARVVGTTEAASNRLAGRGNTPSAKATPAPTWTAPLIRTSSSVPIRSP